MTLIQKVEIEPGMFAPAEQYPADTIRVYIDATHYICYQTGDELPPEPVP